MYKRCKIIVITDLNEINKLLKEIKASSIIKNRQKDKNECMGAKSFIWVDRFNLNILTKYDGSAHQFKFSLCCGKDKEMIAGSQAYNILTRYATLPKCPRTIGTCSALLYKNEKYEGKRVKAYEYDINSAFAYQMLQPIPDTNTMKKATFLKRNQIGFLVRVDEDGKNNLELVLEEGKFADYVFDAIESPFKKFVEVWYNRKKNAKTTEEKLKAKEVLNYSIGYLQLINPFIRACIIGRSNKYTLSYIDEHTIYANTDSIVSTEPREDLEALIGSEIGQFKREHYGDLFAWQKDNLNYQWNLEPPKYRGIPKGFFIKFKEINKRDFDILKDTTPADLLTYEYDSEKNIVKEIIYA